MIQSSETTEESSERMKSPPDDGTEAGGENSERINNPPDDVAALPEFKLTEVTLTDLSNNLQPLGFSSSSSSIFPRNNPPISSTSFSLHFSFCFVSPGRRSGMYSLNKIIEITGSIIIFACNIFCWSFELSMSSKTESVAFIDFKVFLGKFDWLIPVKESF